MIRYVINENWANTPLFIILGKIPMLNLPIKCQSSLTKKFIFSDVILVPNYHGCKGKMINLITKDDKLNNTLFVRYYSQNCKAITFRRITIHTKYK